MTRAVSFAGHPKIVMRQRRRAFGLDAPRPPDANRIEAAILAWLGARFPTVLALKVEAWAGAHLPESSSTLVLVLPGGGAAVLRIEPRPERIEPDAAALAEACGKRRIPLAVVADLEGARAVLRRLGLEPEEG